MLFNSIDFLLFFPAVLIMYYILPKRIKMYWLLIASYYFYMCWNAKYAVLIFISTVITYTSGYFLEKCRTIEGDAKRRNTFRKSIVAVSLISNLGILFGFKYLNFSIDLLSSLCSQFHIVLSIPQFDIILPVGISFYTFQALSYTIDVYRGDISAEKNFFKYALFVSFFPQLVAGPIERSKNLLSQLSEPKRFNYENFREGILLMLWGYFLKIVLADRIALFVDTVYGDINTYPGLYLVIATIMFAIQIYGDFAGYSTIAVGSAKILGIDLMENFKAPYFAESIAGFWRNWHISLTSWFKDYLYIPLGGSRKGKARKYINKMIVFLVSGLWHGANLTYVVWGGLNGLLQVIGEILQPVRDRAVCILGLNRESLGHRLIKILATFAMVDVTWVFFRAKTLAEALNVFKLSFGVHNPWILFDGSLYACGLDIKNFRLVIVSVVILVVADFCKLKGIKIRQIILKQDWWFRILFYATAIVMILLFGKWGPSFDKANFIYFQF